ncbi:MAG: hypothetical protein JNN15_21705, partial [Blastocatellia bacterium]|nr:hypothetical protein [Blastocatellia bacterium]
HTAFSSQFLQAAGRAGTGLDKPYLSQAYLEESIKICEKEGLWAYGANAKATLAAVFAQRGDIKEAINLIENVKSVDLGKNFDHKSKRFLLSRISSYEGKVYGLAKKYPESERAYRNCIEISIEMGQIDPFGISQVRKGLGEALLEQGRKKEALKEFEIVREEFRKL